MGQVFHRLRVEGMSRMICYRLQRFIVLPLLALLCAGSFAVMPVGAAQLSAIPGIVENNTALLVTGTGFAPGEGIQIVGVTPAGTVAYPDAKAEGDGTFYASLIFVPLTSLQATGVTSKTTASLTQIGAPPPNLPDVQVIFPGPRGLTVGGLRPNEAVSVYIVPPDGTSYFIDARVATLAGATQASVFLSAPGFWKVVGTGSASGRSVSYYFFVVPGDYRYNQ